MISRTYTTLPATSLLVLRSMSMSIVGRISGDRQTLSIRAPLRMNRPAWAKRARRYRNRSLDIILKQFVERPSWGCTFP